MKNVYLTFIYGIRLLILFQVVIFTSCHENSMDGKILFTRIKNTVSNRDNLEKNSYRINIQSEIAAVDPGNTGELKRLTASFFSAMSPALSYDGKFLLFAGRQKSDDPWQIYEMKLGDQKVRKVVSSPENCIDPAYLPGDRIVFSIKPPNDSLKSESPLYTCHTDGRDLQRITFSPDSYSHSSVLRDGRIIMIAETNTAISIDSAHQCFALSAHRPVTFMAMRPDGTKAELFYKTKVGSLFTRIYETLTGQMFFITKDSVGGKINLIDYSQPMFTNKDLTPVIKGDFLSVSPLESGKILVSFRSADSNKCALYEFDPGKKILSAPIYEDPEYILTEAFIISKQERPKKLPSEVVRSASSGQLLCQNVNFLNEGLSNSDSAAFIEIMGIDRVMGRVPVKKDGSFYLKLMADQPFKIRALDKEGRDLHRSCDWMWVRPNERRGCVGCHEDTNQVPENRVPVAVKYPPVSVPVQISKNQKP